MCKVVNFLLFLFWSLSVIAADTPQASVSIEKAFFDEGKIECVLNVKPPEDWKLSKKPSIKLVNNDTVKNIAYSDKDEPKILDDGSYEITFFGTANDNINEDFPFLIEMSIPLCKDICTIDTKEIEILVEKRVDAKKPSIPMSGRSIIMLIMSALLGGALLNFMPCVFPVLCLKLKMLMEDNNKQAILGSITGNYATFIAIAIIFTVLKVIGVTLSWGMHFHNLMFLCITTVIVFTFTLYSFELITFEPSFNNVKEHKDIFIKNFISSIIATLISLPCTGPLVGATTAIALNGPIWLMYAVIFCLATGFSAPYIISLFIPISINEKLGSYASIIKKIISAGIGITFSWLLWLVCERIALPYIVAFEVLFLISALAFRAKKKIIGISSLIALLLLSVAVGFFEGECPSFKKQISVNWQEFSPQKITPELIKNNVVLVNISADWCTTCLYYKRTVFESEKFKRFAEDYNVKLFEGDFSLKDEKILEFIKSYDRIGVPFTIVFGPKIPKGKVLSEKISLDEIEKEIKEAGGKLAKIEKASEPSDKTTEDVENLKKTIANKPSRINITVEKNEDLKSELEKAASEKKSTETEDEEEDDDDEDQQESVDEEVQGDSSDQEENSNTSKIESNNNDAENSDEDYQNNEYLPEDEEASDGPQEEEE